MSSPGSSPARRRGRRFLAALVALPLLELVVFLAAADRFGASRVALVVIASMVAGMVVVRRGTPRAWATLREITGRGPTPDHHLSRAAQSGTGRIVATGPAAVRQVGQDLTADVMLLVAGLALAFPGLLSTVVGLALLIPGVRRAAAVALSARIATSAATRVEKLVSSSRGLAAGPVPGDVVRGDVVPGFSTTADPSPNGPVVLRKQLEPPQR